MKQLDSQELIDQGYLQEVNRQFFHPLGLALVIDRDTEGKTNLVVLDRRDELEGLVFEDLSDSISFWKSKNVQLQIKSELRERLYGWVVQPIGHKYKGTTVETLIPYWSRGDNNAMEDGR